MSDTVYVTISGLSGSGKSAIAEQVEIALKSLGLNVYWENSTQEKNMTTTETNINLLRGYKPKVIIREIQLPRVESNLDNLDLRKDFVFI